MSESSAFSGRRQHCTFRRVLVKVVKDLEKERQAGRVQLDLNLYLLIPLRLQGETRLISK